MCGALSCCYLDGAAFAHTMFGVDTAPLVPMEKPLVSPFAVSERTVLVLPVDQRGSAPKNRSTFDVCHPPADFQNSLLRRWRPAFATSVSSAVHDKEFASESVNQ